MVVGQSGASGRSVPPAVVREYLADTACVTLPPPTLAVPFVTEIPYSLETAVVSVQVYFYSNVILNNLRCHAYFLLSARQSDCLI